MPKADPWIFSATVEKWVDGDTFDAKVDLGFRVYRRERFRLVGPHGEGVDAVEVKGPFRSAGIEALALVRVLVPEGSDVRVRVWREQEKYGRWLACFLHVDVAGEIVAKSLGAWKSYA